MDISTVAEERGTTKTGKLLAVVTFATVLSQLPFFVSKGMASNVSIAIWAATAVYCLRCAKGIVRIKNLKTPLAISIVFFAYLGIMGLLNSSYFDSGIPRVVAIAMFVMIVGNIVGPAVTRDDIQIVLLSYAYATVVLAVDVYFEFFRGASFSRIYVYDDKNSTALLLLAGAIIFVVKLSEDKTGSRHKLIHLICIPILAYCMFIMQCRAVYVSLALAIAIFTLSSGLSRKTKFLIVFAVFAITIYYLLNAWALESVLEYFIYVGRNRTDLNDITSGRTKEWSSFWSDLGDGFLFGNGRMKRESLVLTVLLEFGFPIGTALLCLAIYPIRFAVRSIQKKTPFYVLFLSIAVGFITNMFFEQLTPFGPGVKCFLMWFLLGVLASWQNAPNERITV